MSRVAVIVLAWNGQAYLPACLAALAAQDYSGDYAVLVVDNGSTDGSVALVQADFPGMALLQNPTNLGFARGNNVGVRALLAGQAPAPADGVPDIIVLLNQDTEVAPDWLTRIVQTFARCPEAGIVGCKIFFPDGTTLQHTGGILEWPLATGRHRGTGEQESGQYDSEETVEYVTGAAMAVRTTLFEEVGLLDEGFTPAYYEDVDLCYRARAAGFAIIYAPEARLIHAESTSLEGQSPRHQRAYHRNRLRFLLKHAPLAVLRHDFAPAEREEIARWSLSNSLARKRAYFENMLLLPDLLQQRSDIDDPAAVRGELVTLLRDLHEAVVDEEHRRRIEAATLPPRPVPTLTLETAPVTQPLSAPAHAAAPATEPEPEPEPAPAAEPEPEPEPSPAPAAEPEPAPAAEPEPVPAAEPEPVPVPEPAPNPLAELQRLPLPEPLTAPEPLSAGDHALAAIEEPVPEPAVDVTAIMRQVRRQISERQGNQVGQDLHIALDRANQQWDQIYAPLALSPPTSFSGRLWNWLRVRLHHEVRGYLDAMIYRQTEFNASVVRALNSLARRSNFTASTAEVEALRDELIQLREEVRQLQGRSEEQR